MNIIQKIEQEQLKPNISPFKVGDTIRVHTRVVEGDKERIQIFTGIVIGRRGTGINSTFTVRRIALSRIAQGRPWRLALRALAVAAASYLAVAAAGWEPASAAVMTGALTWLLRTGRADLGPKRPYSS